MSCFDSIIDDLYYVVKCNLSLAKRETMLTIGLRRHGHAECLCLWLHHLSRHLSQAHLLLMNKTILSQMVLSFTSSPRSSLSQEFMFAQSSDSVNTDDIGEFLDDSIKGKNILVGYTISLSFGVFLHIINSHILL